MNAITAKFKGFVLFTLHLATLIKLYISNRISISNIAFVMFELILKVDKISLKLKDNEAVRT